MKYTKAELQDQAMANLAEIQRRFATVDATASVREITATKFSQSIKLRKLQRLTQELSNLAAPVTACKNGCNHCCYQAVSVSEVEARSISNYIGKEFTNPTASDIYRDREQYRGDPCPFLVEGKCTVYPVRPIVCSTHINMCNDSEICNVFYPIQEVPYLSTNQLLPIISHVCGQMYYDIRSWFPKDPS